MDQQCCVVLHRAGQGKRGLCPVLICPIPSSRVGSRPLRHKAGVQGGTQERVVLAAMAFVGAGYRMTRTLTGGADRGYKTAELPG